MPADRSRLSIGGPLGRRCVPWYTPGRNAAPQLAAWPLGSPRPLGSLITTNPGRLRLSLPRPYVTHDPAHGKPIRGRPVFIMNSAGEWLFDSVYAEWMNAILSTCSPRWGNSSETLLPHSPRGANRNGDFMRPPTW